MGTILSLANKMRSSIRHTHKENKIVYAVKLYRRFQHKHAYCSTLTPCNLLLGYTHASYPFTPLPNPFTLHSHALLIITLFLAVAVLGLARGVATTRL